MPESGRPRINGRPLYGLNFDTLCQEQSVFDIDTKIADRILDLGMTQQNLDCPNVAGGPIDHRGFCPPKRVRSVFGLPKTNCSHPFINQAGILARAHVSGVVDSAGKEIFDRGAAPSLQPCQQCRSHIGGEFELHWSIGFLLDDDRAIADVGTGNHIANPDLHQIAAAQLTIDGEIEERLVPQTSFAIEVKADCPYGRFQSGEIVVVTTYACLTRCHLASVSLREVTFGVGFSPGR